jgi:hypothetical protein
MLKFNASAFYRSVSLLREIIVISENREKNPKYEKGGLTKGDAKILSAHLQQLKKSLDVLGTAVTAVTCEEALEIMRVKKSRDKFNAKSLTSYMTHISGTLRRELSLINVFVLEKDKTEYFDPPECLFGKTFETKFPLAVFEVDEAAKCFALSRDTAAVFHLMRAMEICIRATARCLGIPDPTAPRERNWGDILKKIKDSIDGKNVAKPWTNSEDREFFESAYVSLDAVRVAWRNTTMHVENKYASEEAEHIFVAVRGFCKTLSSRLDENGLPKA